MKLIKALLLLFVLASFSYVASEALAKKPAKTTKKKKKPAPKKKEVVQEEKIAPLPNEVHPALPSGTSDEIVFVAGGDTMIGSDYPSEATLPPDDGAKVLADVTPILSAADIAFANLEGPLLDGGKSNKCKPKTESKGCYTFRTPTRYGKNFKDAGIDVMSLANNHGTDFGEEGLESSAKVLEELGIAHAGKVGDIAYLTSKGKTVAVIGFAASAGYLSATFWDLEKGKALLQEAQKKADIVVISIHGGREGAKHQHFNLSDGVNSALYQFAHGMIDEGADLVLCHGPHVLRGMEVYKGRLIAYSLGNFATYRRFNLQGVNGLSVLLEVHLGLDGSFLKGQLHPLKQPFPGGPVLDPSGESIARMRALTEADFPKTGAVIADDGSFTAKP